MPRSVEPPKPPKPGSAKAKLFEDMQKKFGGEEPTVPKPGPKSEAPKPPASQQDGDQKSAPAEAEGVAPAASATPPKKGVSPWKMVDEYKARAAKAEARILELEKQVVPEEQAKQAQQRIEQMQARMKEMEDDLRFSHAEKYDPEVLKSKQEYDRAFTRAMSELKDVTISDNGMTRAMTVNDLAELAFMPLGQAQSVAKEVFGDLAPYVMDQRNEIRKLWDARQAQLEDIKKNGVTRAQQQTEARQKAIQQANEFITKTYEEANREAAEDPQHGHFFKPKEGDTEWNTRLEKGFKLVDDAYAHSASDPKLTIEQRRDVIRKHAAVRNRAAAFGALRWQNDALRKELADLKAELKAFKDTTPKAGGRAAEPPAARARGMQGLMDDLQKIAH